MALLMTPGLNNVLLTFLTLPILVNSFPNPITPKSSANNDNNIITQKMVEQSKSNVYKDLESYVRTNSCVFPSKELVRQLDRTCGVPYDRPSVDLPTNGRVCAALNTLTHGICQVKEEVSDQNKELLDEEAIVRLGQNKTLCDQLVDLAAGLTSPPTKTDDDDVLRTTLNELTASKGICYLFCTDNQPDRKILCALLVTGLRMKDNIEREPLKDSAPGQQSKASTIISLKKEKTKISEEVQPEMTTTNENSDMTPQAQSSPTNAKVSSANGDVTVPIGPRRVDNKLSRKAFQPLPVDNSSNMEKAAADSNNIDGKKEPGSKNSGGMKDKVLSLSEKHVTGGQNSIAPGRDPSLRSPGVDKAAGQGTSSTSTIKSREIPEDITTTSTIKTETHAGSDTPSAKPATTKDTIATIQQNVGEDDILTNDNLPRPDDQDTDKPTLDVMEDGLDDYMDVGMTGKNQQPVQPQVSEAGSDPAVLVPMTPDSHFFTYFLAVVVFCIVLYLVFHNKQKIIALIIEGRQDRARRGRANSGAYRKLDSSLEEVMQAPTTGLSSAHVIY